MATLRASDTLTILREMNEAAASITAAMALLDAADAEGLILGSGAAIKDQLRKALAATEYGREWMLKTQGLIADLSAEPVTLPATA